MAKKSNWLLQEEERRKTIKAQSDQQKENHKMKMEELKFQRETERISHENNMTRQRIKSAEIRKAQERREWLKQLKGGERQ